MENRLRESVLALLRQLKEEPAARDSRLAVQQHQRLLAWLDPVTRQDAHERDAVALLARWREAAADAFPSQFPVTIAGTQRWLVKGLLDLPDRLLYWVKTPAGERIGHAGLFRFDFAEHNVELDNIVRGVPGVLPGIMYYSIQCLLAWTFEVLGMESVFLRVFSDNARAIRLYERCGFQETMRMPLRREQEGEVVRWVEVGGDYRRPVNRYFVTMGLPYIRWLSLRNQGEAA